jgi:amino-acid N-acetyltransferase
MRFGDLREILHYVPQFRGRVFVIAFDGAIVASENFNNVLLDLAVLHSLKIRVVVVFGAGHQIQEAGRLRGIELSSHDGCGPVDEATLDISLDAISRLSSTLMQKFTSVGLRTASANVLMSHPAGVVKGVDFLKTGRIGKVDTQTLETLIADEVVPLVAPLGFDAHGETLRLNSDAVAAEIGMALRATKIIYLRDGELPGTDQNSNGVPRQLSVDEARQLAESGAESKFRYAAVACRSGVPRVHILDGSADEALLRELFSTEGIGTMVYADAYQRIRSATIEDVPRIAALIRQSVEDEEIVRRDREDVAKRLDDYLLLEVDGNVIATVALHRYPDSGQAEIACLFVSSGHTHGGHGQKMVAYAEALAAKEGFRNIFALSTQAVEFFRRKAGFSLGDASHLPAERRQHLEQSGRNSKVLVKAIPPG